MQLEIIFLEAKKVSKIKLDEEVSHRRLPCVCGSRSLLNTHLAQAYNNQALLVQNESKIGVLGIVIMSNLGSKVQDKFTCV